MFFVVYIVNRDYLKICAINVLDAVAIVECGPLGCGPMWSRVDGRAQVYLGSHLLVC
jgi:hypothetical protein